MNQTSSVGLDGSLVAELRAAVPEPVYLAWLLRSDVRVALSGCDAGQVAGELLAWWVLHGQAETGNDEALPEAARQILWGGAPPGWTTLPPVLARLARRRDGPREPEAALRAALTDPELRQRLDATLPAALRAWLDAPADGMPAGVSRRVAWEWEADEARFEAFDLFSPEDVPRFLASRPAAPPPPAAAATQLLEGVRLVGFGQSEFGVGEDVRMAAAACAAAGIPFDVEAMRPQMSMRHQDRSLPSGTAPGTRRQAHLFCFTAADTAIHRLAAPPPPGEQPMRIGLWPWELATVPAAWAPLFDLVDEIWAASRHTRDAFAAATDKPVLYMPPAVAIPPPAPLGRAAFGLPEDRLLFGFAFDRNSFVARKNPLACLAAFQAAFPPGDDRVRLLIKVIGPDSEDADWQTLRARLVADPRVHLLEGTLDRAELLALLGCCDALLSLHRAEGFGRVLAEAMLLGVPVIATDWSGNRDYLSAATGFPVRCRLVDVAPDAYPWSDGARWAEPDIADAARQMRRILADPAGARARAAAALALMRDQHGPAAVGARYRARLAHLTRQALPSDRD